MGPQVRTAQLPINVYPAFDILSPWGVTYSLAPCTPLVLTNIEVIKNSPIIGDVTLALRAAGPYVLASSQPFFTPVIKANVNMAELELSGQDSS